MANLNPRMAKDSAPTDPAVGSVAITGSAQTLSTTGRGLLITETGDIAFSTQDGSSVTWNNIPVGIHPITVRAISSASASGYVLI